MALPKIDHPIYTIYLKSLNRDVKFRPFLVKEEKILLMAKESKDVVEIQTAVKQIIGNCCLEQIDIDALPLFDIEMAFLKLRARSVGESVKFIFNCQNETGQSENGDPIICNTDTDYAVDLAKIEFVTPEGHDPKVMITDKLGIKLKYPTISMDLTRLKDSTEKNEEDNKKESAYDILLQMIIDNIEYIFDMESIYKPEDTPAEELDEFLLNLNSENMEKIQEFFNTAPTVTLIDHVKCKKCGFEHTLKTEGLLSFFI